MRAYALRVDRFSRFEALDASTAAELESAAPLPSAPRVHIPPFAAVGAVAASCNKHAKAEASKPVNTRPCEVRYAVGRELDGFPTWTATFVGSRRLDEMQDVYDISVPATRNFVAMGITVHNCDGGSLTELYKGVELNVRDYVYCLMLSRRYADASN